ncbi:MAG TPA: LamG domain-containing protein, partial [Candidatus Paceibacterota bacterium]|nr:LamG domain-containing protein [Candidatus Paceibacterota bacterium]
MKHKLGSAVISALVVLGLTPLVAFGASYFFVDDQGNVGIGNSSPQARLDVSGAFYSRLASTTSSTIDWNDANVQATTLTSNKTFTFTNGEAGGEYKLIINQDGTGGRTISWPNSVIWENATTPSVTSSANATDMASFVYDGTHYLGSYHANFKTASALVNSLVSYWKLDESSGNATDSVGGNTLTNEGSTPFASAKINNGASLDGSSGEYLDITSVPSNLEPSGAFTMNAWVKVSSFSGAPQILVKSHGSGWSSPYMDYQFAITSTAHPYFNMNYSSDFDGIESTTTLSTGTWYMLTYVFDGSNLSIYINGALDTGPTAWAHGSIAYGSGPLRLGRNTSSGEAMDGIIDETGFWSRA